MSLADAEATWFTRESYFHRWCAPPQHFEKLLTSTVTRRQDNLRAWLKRFLGNVLDPIREATVHDTWQLLVR